MLDFLFLLSNKGKIVITVKVQNIQINFWRECVNFEGKMSKIATNFYLLPLFGTSEKGAIVYKYHKFAHPILPLKVFVKTFLPLIYVSNKDDKLPYSVMHQHERNYDKLQLG